MYLDEFWRWAERHRSYIDFSRMEPLVLGKEPPWVEEQRRKDRTAFPVQRKTRWTPEEDGRLRMLLGQYRYTWPELADLLHRSEGAIQRRCRDLGIRARPLRASGGRRWTKGRCAVLADGIRAADSYAAIAKRLGCSEKAVRSKVHITYRTEDADAVRRMLGDGPWGGGAPDLRRSGGKGGGRDAL